LIGDYLNLAARWRYLPIGVFFTQGGLEIVQVRQEEIHHPSAIIGQLKIKKGVFDENIDCSNYTFRSCSNSSGSQCQFGSVFNRRTG